MEHSSTAANIHTSSKLVVLSRSVLENLNTLIAIGVFMDISSSS